MVRFGGEDVLIDTELISIGKDILKFLLKFNIDLYDKLTYRIPNDFEVWSNLRLSGRYIF